jgi:hypothetical protein
VAPNAPMTVISLSECGHASGRSDGSTCRRSDIPMFRERIRVSPSFVVLTPIASVSPLKSALTKKCRRGFPSSLLPRIFAGPLFSSTSKSVRRNHRFASSLFSSTYKSLFPQPLSLHIHTKPRGVWALLLRSLLRPSGSSEPSRPSDLQTFKTFRLRACRDPMINCEVTQ